MRGAKFVAEDCVFQGLAPELIMYILQRPMNELVLIFQRIPKADVKRVRCCQGTEESTMLSRDPRQTASAAYRQVRSECPSRLSRAPRQSSMQDAANILSRLQDRTRHCSNTLERAAHDMLILPSTTKQAMSITAER